LIAFFFVGGWLVPIDPSFFQSSTSVLILLLTTDWLDPFLSGILFLHSAKSIGHAFHQPRCDNRIFLACGVVFCSLADTKRGHSLPGRGRRHPPEDIADIVSDKQSACAVHRHADGAPESVALGIDKAGEIQHQETCRQRKCDKFFLIGIGSSHND
jgi:hypothetical protein